MFNSTNTITIFTFFLKFLSAKKGSNLGPEITWCIGMKHLNVKKCTLSPSPEDNFGGKNELPERIIRKCGA